MLHSVRNLFFKVVGALILFCVWAKHRLLGYRKPNTVSADDEEARIAYVHEVVQSWLKFLPADVSVEGRSVLELGPGSSLATGTLLLSQGAKSYLAVDAFPLAAHETEAFRQEALARLTSASDRSSAMPQASSAGTGHDFDYRVDAGFDIPAICRGQSFDLILSCAAFEHFDAIEKTIDGLSKVAKSGCVSLHIVDLQTHTNLIRERDPNNIYRFSSWFYRTLWFPGQPNRKRPSDYVRAFERNGWVDIKVIPAKEIDESLRPKLTSGLARSFMHDTADMHILDAVIISRYP